MQHSLAIEGRVFRLRPVGLADAGFIVTLRSDSDRCKFVHPISTKVQDQEEWIRQYFLRPGDCYFIIERISTGTPEGTIGIYDLDEQRHCAEWGRWVLKPGSAAAIESAYQIYQAAFDRLNLDSLYCRTLADNQKVVSFHASFGLETIAVHQKHFQFNGEAHDAVEQRMTRTAWKTQGPVIAGKIDALARLLAK